MDQKHLLVIRALFAGIFSLLFFKTEAQSKKLKATLSNYFINLPYDKYFPDWIDEIKTDPQIKVNHLSLLDTSFRLLLTGRIDSTILAGTDSTRIAIGKSFIRSAKTMNRSLVSESTHTIYFLQQVYFFSKETIEQAWEEFFAKIKKELKKHTVLRYPTAPKQSPSLQTIWFEETDISGPLVILQQGKSKNQPAYYILIQLNFTIGASE